jgi:putative PD-(D/E)XK family protein DUF4420
MKPAFPDLVQLFDGLSPSTADVGLGRFCALSIPGYPFCAVGKDINGNPVLLIEADNAQPGTAPPLVLEHLTAIHLINCHVQNSHHAAHDRTLSVIRCTGTDRTLHEYFLRSLHPVIVSLPPKPSRQQISDAVERLVDLFRQMSEAPRKAVAGLWAELFVIAQADNPTRLLASWHAMPEERFDFTLGIDRLDVKSASGGVRIHHFSLEQLRPTAPSRVVIVSLLTERVEGGTSINDLIDVIRSRIADPSLLIRLDSVVAQTLGQDWRTGQQVRFDLQQAIHSLRFVEADAIPSVPVPVPAEVSAVHFRVDMTQHPLLCPNVLMNESELFRAILPPISIPSAIGLPY